MLSEEKKTEVLTFLSQVKDMTESGFAFVYDAGKQARPIGVEALPRLKLSAADFSWMDHQVREVVSHLLADLPWERGNVKRMALTYTQFAAEAIACRNHLTNEQYEAFVDGFRQAGLDVPPYGTDFGEVVQ